MLPRCKESVVPLSAAVKTKSMVELRGAEGVERGAARSRRPTSAAVSRQEATERILMGSGEGSHPSLEQRFLPPTRRPIPEAAPPVLVAFIAMK